MSEGASSVGTAADAGNMAGNAGMGAETAGSTGGYMNAGDMSSVGPSEPSFWQKAMQAGSDYSQGSQGSFGDAINDYRNGNYMKTAGYLGNKVMGSNPGNSPTPLINLPQGQQQNDPMNRYAQLYAKYRGMM